MATNAQEMSLKLLIDGASKKVLYAEAKKDFIDFLFGRLQIPIGSIMTLLVENGLKVSGSFGRVLKSVSDMGDSHFHSSQLKDSLVKPKVYYQQAQNPYNPPLLLQEFASWDSTGQTPTRCCNNSGGRMQACYQCGHYCATAALNPTPVKVEGYLKADNCGYMVMDDLVAAPSPSSLSSESSESRIFPRSKRKSSRLKSRSNGERTQTCYSYDHSCVRAAPAPTPSKVEGYVKAEKCGYMVMDDLVVSPMSTISVFALLKKFKIKDLSLLEEKIVKVDLKKGLELVKASMVSDMILTDVFI